MISTLPSPQFFYSMPSPFHPPFALFVSFSHFLGKSIKLYTSLYLISLYQMLQLILFSRFWDCIVFFSRKFVYVDYSVTFSIICNFCRINFSILVKLFLCVSTNLIPCKYEFVVHQQFGRFFNLSKTLLLYIYCSWGQKKMYFSKSEN